MTGTSQAPESIRGRLRVSQEDGKVCGPPMRRQDCASGAAPFFPAGKHLVASRKLGKAVRPRPVRSLNPVLFGALRLAAERSMTPTAARAEKNLASAEPKEGTALRVLAEPLGSRFRLIEGLVVMIPVAFLWRQRLRRNLRTSAYRPVG